VPSCPGETAVDVLLSQKWVNRRESHPSVAIAEGVAVRRTDGMGHRHRSAFCLTLAVAAGAALR